MKQSHSRLRRHQHHLFLDYIFFLIGSTDGVGQKGKRFGEGI